MQRYTSIYVWVPATLVKQKIKTNGILEKVKKTKIVSSWRVASKLTWKCDTLSNIDTKIVNGTTMPIDYSKWKDIEVGNQSSFCVLILHDIYLVNKILNKTGVWRWGWHTPKHRHSVPFQMEARGQGSKDARAGGKENGGTTAEEKVRSTSSIHVCIR